MTENKILMSLEQKVDPAHAALIVVDVQNDFCADEGFFGSEGYDLRQIKAAVPRIGNLINQARAAGVKVIFIRSIYDPHHLNDPMRERNQRRGLGKARCTTGAWGRSFSRWRRSRANRSSRSIDIVRSRAPTCTSSCDPGGFA